MSATLRFEFAGVPRTARLHPAPSTSTRSGILVVVLHGKGGTAEWAETETGWSDWADRNDCSVLYPEALPPRPDRPAKFLTNPPAWDDTPGSIDLAFLRHLLNLPQFASMELVVTGFSNGAAMAFQLAASWPDRVRAVAPVAGYYRGSPQRLPRSIPTLYIIGDADPLIPLAGGPVHTPWRTVELRPPIALSLAAWAEANAFTRLQWEPRDPHSLFQHTSRADHGAVMELVIVPGLGHHWPGGGGGLGERMGGPIVSTVDATNLIGRFFLTQNVAKTTLLPVDW